MSCGGRIEEIHDAIMISPATSYADLKTSVNARAERCFRNGNGKICRGTVMLKLQNPQRSMSVDDGNWEAVRALLERKDATLDFIFVREL